MYFDLVRPVQNLYCAVFKAFPSGLCCCRVASIRVRGRFIGKIYVRNLSEPNDNGSSDQDDGSEDENFDVYMQDLKHHKIIAKKEEMIPGISDTTSKMSLQPKSSTRKRQAEALIQPAKKQKTRLLYDLARIIAKYGRGIYKRAEYKYWVYHYEALEEA